MHPIKDADAGIPTLFGLGLLAANRLVAIPFNLYEFNNYQISKRLGEIQEPFPKKHLSILISPFSYDYISTLGLSLQWKYLRTKFTLNGSGLESDVARRVAGTNDFQHFDLKQESGFGLGIEGNLRVTQFFYVHPSLQISYANYTKTQSIFTGLYSDSLQSHANLNSSTLSSSGFKTMASLALTICPRSWLGLELGAGYIMSRPSIENQFESYKRTYNPELRPNSDFTFSLQGEIFVW